jgi:branched-chain amino acid transport system permease protein
MPRALARLVLLFRQPPLEPYERRLVIAVIAAAIALATLPGWLGAYSLSTFRDALIFSLLALSLDFLWGRAHVLSLGHAMFFGIGAYGMAIATTKLAAGSAAGLGLGIAAAAAIAGAVGYFLIFAGVRLHFFAVITMALLLIAGQIAVSWSSVTGGDIGILGVPGLRFSIAGLEVDLSGDVRSFYLALVLLGIVLLLLWGATRSNYGKVLSALGMNEFRAETLGHNTSAYLLVVFVLAAGLAAFAGGLYAATSGVVAPDLFSALLSTEILVWVAVGGRGTLVGPVVATFLVLWMQLQLSSISTSLWPIVLGTIFVLQVVFLPDGLAALVRRRNRPSAQPAVSKGAHP